MKKYILSIALVALGVFPVKAQTIITFYTNLGSFEVELFDTLQPITAGNIKTLVNNKFYDGVIFHRIIDNFVIQGGDPTGTGSGGPGYTIADEFDSTLSNVKKTLSMANSGPNSGGSQFFINLKNNTFLDFDKAPLTSAHPVFGVVISGWDTVEMIEAVPVNSSDRPLNDVVMDSVRITQFPLGVSAPNLSELGIDVFPNPINNNSVVQIASDKSHLVEIAIFNQSGNLVKSSTKTINNGVNQFELSSLGTSNLPSGIYSLRFSYDGNIVTKRFVVTK